MALGSIEHLQYYFTKTGIAAKQSSQNKKLKGLVPALGPSTHIRNASSVATIAFDLPPTPTIPQVPHFEFPPHVKTQDPDSLLPDLVSDLTTVLAIWHIDADPSTSTIDVLHLLKVTTNAVRSVRNYVMALPDDSAGTLRAQFRSKALSPASVRAKASTTAEADPLTLIRRSALEVLTVLRELEEKSRLPLSHDAYDANSEGHSSGGLVDSPEGSNADLPPTDDRRYLHAVDTEAAVSFSLVKIPGRDASVPVWEDEEHFEEHESDEEPRERWDERLVVGNGWLYRKDITLSELAHERQVVESYIDLVDDVLFEGKRDNGQRGWKYQLRKLEKTKKRRVSAGDVERRGLGLKLSPADRRVSTGIMRERITEDEEEEETPLSITTEGSIDDDDLPPWAKRDVFVEDEIGRAHCLLSTLLKPPLLDALSPATSRTEFLDSLSSGQLLCAAYNSGVRQSRRPWGYVNKEGVHDIISLEREAAAKGEARKTGWTFRRADNLRLWVGALRLRYMLPISVPAVPQSQGRQTSPGPAQVKFPGQYDGEIPIHFDAKVVARKEEGWEDMLQVVLLRWVSKVVDEQRSGL
ncbi:hypothetical protein CYLTODRAFT_424106 [Cylindrobasidium torrendii FP15055 ss-10]|uniref:Uncharacterized protein n=1 Tax=Cylindrobasidium torrendii FP15055 ss-10 TaxID=1314674 RepID=A0A0D7B850_9AGAR|nr:hypothetical protein CYLTODRAFT_424106 [Cylindrobasidium torrendii FP15055 ss-10]